MRDYSKCPGAKDRVKTQSKIMDTSLSQSVSKILTAYWSKKTYFRPGAWKTEIHSFPTMYIMGGGFVWWKWVKIAIV